jgi:hypothetical protein
LWVNLPKALKMSAPRYQEVVEADIPTHKNGGCTLRVVAGSVDGVTGPVAEIAAAPLYLDVRLDENTEFMQPLPEEHTALAYLFEGEAVFGNQLVSAVHMIQFGPGEHIRVRTQRAAARFMLMAGRPFGEPIAPYGPFVMNTQDEIRQALAELRNGTFIRDEQAPS